MRRVAQAMIPLILETVEPALSGALPQQLPDVHKRWRCAARQEDVLQGMSARPSTWKFCSRASAKATPMR